MPKKQPKNNGVWVAWIFAICLIGIVVLCVIYVMPKIPKEIRDYNDFSYKSRTIIVKEPVKIVEYRFTYRNGEECNPVNYCDKIDECEDATCTKHGYLREETFYYKEGARKKVERRLTETTLVDEVDKDFIIKNVEVYENGVIKYDLRKRVKVNICVEEGFSFDKCVTENMLIYQNISETVEEYCKRVGIGLTISPVNPNWKAWGFSDIVQCVKCGRDVSSYEEHDMCISIYPRADFCQRENYNSDECYAYCAEFQTKTDVLKEKYIACLRDELIWQETGEAESLYCVNNDLCFIV